MTVKKFTLAESVALNTYGAGSRYATCDIYYLDKDSHVTEVSFYKSLENPDEGVVGFVYAVSNGDNKIYGDISGTSSETFTFTETLRMQGLKGLTESLNDSDPANIIYGDVENISVISF